MKSSRQQPRKSRRFIAVFATVAVFAIVGNEDGAHHITATVFQALNDVGWTIPAASACYWVGEAMHKIDFKDLETVPKVTDDTARMVASNAAHLAAPVTAGAGVGAGADV